MTCGVGRVPNFQRKFNDVSAWLHPECNLLSQGFFTKSEKVGMRQVALVVPVVKALPPPATKEKKEVSSSVTLALVALA